MGKLKRCLATFFAFLMLFYQCQEVLAAAKKVSIQDISLRFGNNPSDFGYEKDAEVGYVKSPYNEDLYKTAFGENAAATAYFKTDSESFLGNCFGETAIAMLLYMSKWSNGVFPDLKKFYASAHLVSDIPVSSKVTVSINGEPKTVTLRYLIELLQISQRGFLIQQAYQGNKNAYESLVASLTTIKTSAQNPVLIGIGMDRGDGNGFNAHALVAYDYEIRTDGKDGTEVVIKVYDPNDALKEHELILYRDKYEQYTGWSYTMVGSGEWGTNVQSANPNTRACEITYIPYENVLSTWTTISNAGYISIPTRQMFVAIGYDRDNHQVNKDDVNFTIQTFWGKHYARIVKGIEQMDSETSGNQNGGYFRVFEARSQGMTKAEDFPDPPPSGKGIDLWIPTGAYKIINDGKADGSTDTKWTVTVVHPKQSITVSTTAKEVYVYVDDTKPVSCVEIAEPDKLVSIALRTSWTNEEDELYPKGGVKKTPDSTSSKSPYAVLRYQGQLYAGDYEKDTRALRGAHDELLKIIPPTERKPWNLSQNSVHYDGVCWVLNNGIGEGVADKADDEYYKDGILFVDFNHDGSCSTRAILKFLYNYRNFLLERKGKEMQSPNSPCRYPVHEKFKTCVAWADEEHILGNVPDYSTFEEECSRAKAMYYFWKMQGEDIPDPERRADILASFVDLENSELTTDELTAIAWVVDKGIATGNGGCFNPYDTCTRAQIATFLYRMFENIDRFPQSFGW